MNHRICLYVGDARPLYEPEAFERLYQAASQERRAKTDRLRMKKDKCLSLCAESLLARACDDFGIAPGDRTLVLGRYAKPSFTATPVQFNLSHSGTRALCAMSDLAVGCDIEEVRGCKGRIAEHYFTDSEQMLLADCPDEASREAAFYRIWTLKESFLKCTGRGLSLPLSSFSVIPEEGGRARVEQTYDEARYALFEGELPTEGDEPAYRYALCVRTEGEEEIDAPELVFVPAP